MRNPCARSATIEPIFPQPTRPRHLPVNSVPIKRDFSHFPAFVDCDACGIWRANASIMAIACSAVVTALPYGVFITTTPRLVAAAMSTLSTPIPARPTTFKLSAAARTASVTLVAERIANPSYAPMMACNSSADRPVLTSASTPCAANTSTAFWLNLSLISTFGIGFHSFF